MSKYSRRKALFVLTGVGLVAMLFLGASPLILSASPQTLVGNYNRGAAESYADAWTCNNCTEPHNPNYNYYPNGDWDSSIFQVNMLTLFAP